MKASISSAWIRTVPTGKRELSALSQSRDPGAFDRRSLLRPTQTAADGKEFVVTGYDGGNLDLGVDEDSRIRLTPVTSLALSVRSMNCLRAEGISTVGELSGYTTDALLSVPNMGMKSVLEIRERLSQLGIRDQRPTPWWERYLDLRLLLRLADIDQSLAAIISHTAYQSVWEMCAADVMGLKNRFSNQVLGQLSEALKRIGIPMSTVVPKWLPPNAGPIRAAFATEISALAEVYQEAPARGSSLAVAVGAPSASTSLSDEIDRFILGGIKPDYKLVISLRKGWDGGHGATLDEVGTAYELTRERVRQIEKKLKPAMPQGGFKFLKKALDVVGKAAPCRTETAESALWGEFSGDLRITIEGLLSAAEIVGISPNALAVERIGTEKFVGSTVDLERVRQIERVACADISHYGVGHLASVRAKLPMLDPTTILEFLRGSAQCCWDPENSSTFYLPTARNALLSRLRRILSVISPISADLARTQILRDQRMEGSEFSSAMLSRIAQAQTWCRVSDDQISTTEGFEADNEESNEAKVVALLRHQGPVMDSRILLKLALQIGVSDAHLNTLLGSSPLIVKHGRALYGLIGSVPSPELSSSATVYKPELQPLPSPDETDLDGIAGLAHSDPASSDFCIHAFACMAKRARHLRGTDPWSIVEVFGSPAERGLLRQWGREGTADVKWLRARSVTYEGEQIPARNALALLFLAYSAETARTESSEGEMWRQIRESLNQSLATEFFFSNGYARPWLREATELVCRRLHVRNAFGQEGEQGWLRTVYLQFGMTTAGFNRLPYWLSGYGVPVAVEDLQDRSSNLFSHSFSVLWEALGDYRIGGRAESEVRRLLVLNPWAGPEFAEELLACAIQRREIVRASESNESEAISGSVSSLFSSPKLLWREEPYFELSMSAEPPPWLEDAAYTLVVSDGQQIPITRVDGVYEMAGIGSTLVVSARLQSVGIDVLQRRVSVVPGKIEIDFRPKSELAFYRLSDGRMFDRWEDIPKGQAPFAVLHRVHDHLAPPTSEFSLVLGGEWQLSAYRGGMPADLCLNSEEQIVWQRAEPSADRKEGESFEARVTCDGGKWGQRKRFLVTCSPPNLRPVEAIIGTQLCPLVSGPDGEVSGNVTLEPTTASAPTARLVAREGLRLRSLRALVDIGPVTGAAFDHLGAWVPLHGIEIFPVHKFVERLFTRPPSLWKGEAFEERDWAILEGDRILDRPSRRGQILRHSLFGLGEEMRLAVNNGGEWWKGFKIVQGVVDTGLIRSAESTESAVTIELLRDIEIGENHELWVWPTNASEPRPLAREFWRVREGRIVAEVETSSTAAIAFAFKGLWLGAISLGRDHSWLTFKGIIEHTDCWPMTAEWMRWFRVPVLLPNLRSAVLMKVESDPAGTFVAWTNQRRMDPRATFSDEHRERWAQVIRAFLYFWQPTPEEAKQVLGALGVLPGDPLEIVEAFETIKEGWQHADSLARIDPATFSSLIISALPAAYPNARQDERAVLVKILRKQIMGTDQELSLEDFSWRIGLDRRFASAVLNAESLRRERSLSLRIALGDYSVRQFVCVRLLDEGLSQRLI